MWLTICSIAVIVLQFCIVCFGLLLSLTGRGRIYKKLQMQHIIATERIKIAPFLSTRIASIVLRVYAKHWIQNIFKGSIFCYFGGSLPWWSTAINWFDSCFSRSLCLFSVFNCASVQLPKPPIPLLTSPLYCYWSVTSLFFHYFIHFFCHFFEPIKSACSRKARRMELLLLPS